MSSQLPGNQQHVTDELLIPAWAWFSDSMWRLERLQDVHRRDRESGLSTHNCSS
jgi:hypothetical protein